MNSFAKMSTVASLQHNKLLKHLPFPLTLYAGESSLSAKEYLGQGFPDFKSPGLAEYSTRF